MAIQPLISMIMQVTGVQTGYIQSKDDIMRISGIGISLSCDIYALYHHRYAYEALIFLMCGTILRHPNIF